MYTKINQPRGLNSGSCKALAEYLDKEEGGFFFDRDDNRSSLNRVVKSIDKLGKGGLKKTDDKFYMISFSPSHQELCKMLGINKERLNDIKSVDDLSYDYKQKLYESLSEYTHGAMDIYAKNFKRKGVDSHKDLTYFGRVETERTYNHYDKEVLEGRKRTGERKEGLNFHVHVIVSRKAKNNALLSPNTRFRNKTFNQGKGDKTRGFDYTDFTEQCYEHFCDKFKIAKDGKNHRKMNPLSLIKGNTIGTIKGKIQSSILQDNLQEQRQLVSNTLGAVNTAKNLYALAAPTNPVSAAQAAAKLALKAVRTIANILE